MVNDFLSPCLEFQKEQGFFVDSEGHRYVRIDDALIYASPLSPSYSPTLNQTNELPEGHAWVYIVVSIMLVLLGGVFSGLNVALMSLTPQRLKTLAQTNPTTNKRVKYMQRILRDRNLLLVTLLVSNACCMEALPIFIDKLVNSWVAIVISSTAVLFFGEILPQGLFLTYPVFFGYYFGWLIELFMMVLYLPSKFISVVILDRLVGKDSEVELLRRVQGYPLDLELFEKVLKFKSHTVEHTMVPWSNVVKFPTTTTLKANMIRDLKMTGETIYPVHEEGHPHKAVGYIRIPQNEHRREIVISKAKLHDPIFVPPTDSIYHVLRDLCNKKRSLAVVTHDDLKARRTHAEMGFTENVNIMGVVTLELLLQEFINLQLSILDRFRMDTATGAIVSKIVRLNRSKSFAERTIRTMSLASDTDHVDNKQSYYQSGRFTASFKSAELSANAVNEHARTIESHCEMDEGFDSSSADSDEAPWGNRSGRFDKTVCDILRTGFGEKSRKDLLRKDSKSASSSYPPAIVRLRPQSSHHLRPSISVISSSSAPTSSDEESTALNRAFRRLAGA